MASLTLLIVIILTLGSSFHSKPVFDMIPAKKSQEERILIKTLVSSVLNKEKELREKTEQLETLLSILNSPISHEMTNKFHGFWFENVDDGCQYYSIQAGLEFIYTTFYIYLIPWNYRIDPLIMNVLAEFVIFPIESINQSVTKLRCWCQLEANYVMTSVLLEAQTDATLFRE